MSSTDPHTGPRVAQQEVEGGDGTEPLTDAQKLRHALEELQRTKDALKASETARATVDARLLQVEGAR